MRRHQFQSLTPNQSFSAVGQNSSKGMSSIILTGANVSSSDSSNSTLVYNFPSSVSFTNHEIAVSSISMYYSWFNLGDSSTSLNNNQFSYTWTVGLGPATTYQVIIPSGIYEISDINNFFQFTMIKNGTYLINSAGQNVFYAELLVNVNRYSVDVNTFLVPTALPTGWTAPVANVAAAQLAFAGFPNAAFNPIITFPATNNFYKLVGYTAGYATTASSTVNQTFNSSVSPQVQPNPTIFLNCNFVSNIYSNPSTNIFAITPTGAIGSQILIQPPEFTFNAIQGTTASLTFQLRGRDGSVIKIQDPNLTFVLCIREKSMMN